MVATGLGEEARLKAAQEVKSAGDGEMGGGSGGGGAADFKGMKVSGLGT